MSLFTTEKTDKRAPAPADKASPAGAPPWEAPPPDAAAATPAPRPALGARAAVRAPLLLHAGAAARDVRLQGVARVPRGDAAGDARVAAGECADGAGARHRQVGAELRHGPRAHAPAHQRPRLPPGHGPGGAGAGRRAAPRLRTERECRLAPAAACALAQIGYLYVTDSARLDQLMGLVGWDGVAAPGEEGATEIDDGREGDDEV